MFLKTNPSGQFNQGDRVTINNGGNTYYIVVNVINTEGSPTKYKIQEEGAPAGVTESTQQSVSMQQDSISFQQNTVTYQQQEVEEGVLCAA